MFKSLKLTNFRRHEDLTVNFTAGLNVVRAANEGGKSTLIESALYALFGTSALRESLDETVTWEKDPKTLRVVLVYQDQHGNEYTFDRSKGGAEVQVNGTPHVTGQREVTAFAAQVLGADAKVAGQLMLANQNGLRGVLEEGPKATAQTIEALANFELFDRILDAAAEKLLLGATAPYESRVKLLREQVQALPEGEAPDEAAYQAAVAEHQQSMGRVQARINDELQPAFVKAQTEWRNAHDVREQAAKLNRDLVQIQAQKQETLNAIEKVEPATKEVVPDTTDLERQLADANTLAIRKARHDKFLTIPKAKGVDRTAWTAEADALERQVYDGQELISSTKADIRVLEAQRVSASVCGLCGKDVSELPEVAAKNKEIDATVAEANTLIKEQTEQLEANRKVLSVVAKTREVDSSIRNMGISLGDFVEVDMSVIPARVTWVGGDVAEATDTKALQVAIKDAKECQKRILAAQGQLQAYQAQLLAVDARAKVVQDQVLALAPLSDTDFQQLEDLYTTAMSAVQAAENLIATHKQEVAKINDEYHTALKQYQDAKQRRQGLLDQIEQIESDIRNIEFNNQLIKKIRAARPVVGNKLWNIVLASVSQLFTRMRGVQSIVSRGPDGFLVNGKGINGLSGSTLDILGLAVRTALVKTFIPGCQMMVLDEPSAGCDTNRTTSLLGFIASAGFEQTILITHEDISESFASNLIQL